MKITPKVLIDIYRLKREGYQDKYIAKAIGVTPACFTMWKKRKASVKYSLEQADEDRKAMDKMSIQDYIGSRLSEKVAPTFERITGYNTDIKGFDKAQKALSKQPEDFQQELFLYSLIMCNFNKVRAMKKIGIDKRVLKRWEETDPNFVELMIEAEEMISEFYREGLFKLIRSGDSAATIFANKTFNREKGYGEVIEKRINASLEVKALPLEVLDGLPADVLRTVLDAVRNYESKQEALPVHSEVIDNEE